MKRLIGLAVLAMGLAVPTQAQTVHAAAAAAGGGTSSPSAGGGGWGGGSGLSGGFTGGQRLAYYPLTRFSMTSVSGSQQEYEPSIFVSYDKAVAAGQNALDTTPLTVAEAARQQGNTHPARAKFVLVQDDYGKLVIVPW